jgi:exodeoxyribonuclease VII large subunit
MEIAPRPEPRPLTVFEVSRRIKESLETAFSRVSVEGEVTGAKTYGSGHTYFSLTGQDPSGGAAKLDCVVWRTSRALVGVDLKDGMKVVATGRVSAYAGSSRYQLVVDRVEDAGTGDLLRRIEELKRRLAAEGLFDEARKRPLPFLPRRVGVVTSLRGAAVRDIVRTALSRYPARLLLVDSLVQGEGAAAGVAAGISLLNAIDDVDVIVIGRGGGSMEDLWAFNEEALVRAVAASAKPIVSAVGHESDHVLTDDAADLRAPTPTYAAKEVVPSMADLRAGLQGLAERLGVAMTHRAEVASQRLDDAEARLKGLATRLLAEPRHRLAQLGTRIEARQPGRKLGEERRALDQAALRLRSAGRHLLDRPRATLETAAARLAPLSPFAPLERGYAMARDSQGRLVNRHDQVAPGDGLDVLLGQGALSCEVVSTRGER